MKANKHGWAYTITFILFLCFIFFVWRDINTPEGNTSHRDLQQTLPFFTVKDLLNPNQNFSEHDLEGQVCLLNIWASWCSSCYREHALLLKIARQYHIPIYSLNFEDGSLAATNWLNHYGNPFIKAGLDSSGAVSKSLGAYGTPETFVIDKRGRIRYQHIGLITETDWALILKPLLDQYQKEAP